MRDKTHLDTMRILRAIEEAKSESCRMANIEKVYYSEGMRCWCCVVNFNGKRHRIYDNQHPEKETTTTMMRGA